MELQSEVGTLKAKGGWKTKAAMRKNNKLSPEDVGLSNDILLLCQQYLFPRIKFLPKGWEVYDPKNKKNFAGIVKVHLKKKLQPNKTFAEEWPRIIMDEIMRKYDKMKCNVNNHIRPVFLGELLSSQYYCSTRYPNIYLAAATT